MKTSWHYLMYLSRLSNHSGGGSMGVVEGVLRSTGGERMSGSDRIAFWCYSQRILSSSSSCVDDVGVVQNTERCVETRLELELAVVNARAVCTFRAQKASTLKMEVAEMAHSVCDGWCCQSKWEKEGGWPSVHIAPAASAPRKEAALKTTPKKQPRVRVPASRPSSSLALDNNIDTPHAKQKLPGRSHRTPTTLSLGGLGGQCHRIVFNYARFYSLIRSTPVLP
jgi:hypothetical protein